MDSILSNDVFKEAQFFLESKGYALIVCAVGVILGLSIIKNIMKVVRLAVIGGGKIDSSLIRLIITFTRFGLNFALVLWVFRMFGISMTGFATVFSACTLALGFALQDVIGGVASGFIIISQKPFNVGDYVSIGSSEGVIREVRLLHTVIDTPDKIRLFIPNKTLYGSEIRNFTVNPIRRIDIKIGVDYDTDIEMAKSVFLQAVSSFPNVLSVPAPEAHLIELADSALVIRLRMWSLNENYWNVVFNINDALLSVARKNNICIPFPQVTLSQRDNSSSSTPAPTSPEPSSESAAAVALSNSVKEVR